jgi:nucleoside 2-deoxyribosyltransferase
MAELETAIAKLAMRVDLLTADPGRRSQQSADNMQYEMTAFVVMPFGHEDLQIVYEDYVKPTIEDQCYLKCIRGDDMFGSEVIMEDILAAISNAEIVVADLTGQNANVFYEVGIAHATSKPVLLLAQSLADVPFDLRHRRVLMYDYSPHGCKKLEQRLKDHILDMRKRRP